jgi:hypothetical protein
MPYKTPLKDGDQNMSGKYKESKNHTILTSSLGFIQGEELRGFSDMTFVLSFLFSFVSSRLELSRNEGAAREESFGFPGRGF